MEDRITLAGVHHFGLRVTELSRSVEFYRDIFGFEPILEVPGLILLSNGNMVFALRDQEAGSADRFDEFRVGLDHISFTLGSRDELE
ncbi:MAG TPA: VOC family protein, partial [Herpetosiphonaceae bacterium]|nr:VOC family protein [Herpetosiphonaceae bacterium]